MFRQGTSAGHTFGKTVRLGFPVADTAPSAQDLRRNRPLQPRGFQSGDPTGRDCLLSGEVEPNLLGLERKSEDQPGKRLYQGTMTRSTSFVGRVSLKTYSPEPGKSPHDTLSPSIDVNCVPHPVCILSVRTTMWSE